MANPPTYDETMKINASAPPEPGIGGYPMSAPYPTAAPYPTGGAPYPTAACNPPYPANPNMPMPMPGQATPMQVPNYQYPQGAGVPPHQLYSQTVIYSNTSQPITAQPIPGGVVVHNVVRPIDIPTDSMNTVCPSCQKQILTRVQHEVTCGTHLCALLICCAFWPLFFVPYVTDCCKSANHTCPHCGTFIGERPFM